MQKVCLQDYMHLGDGICVLADASPWEVGATLHINGTLTEYLLDNIHDCDEKIMGMNAGTHLGQQAWEGMTIVSSFKSWQHMWTGCRVVLSTRSDNVGALIRKRRFFPYQFACLSRWYMSGEMALEKGIWGLSDLDVSKCTLAELFLFGKRVFVLLLPPC